MLGRPILTYTLLHRQACRILLASVRRSLVSHIAILSALPPTSLSCSDDSRLYPSGAECERDDIGILMMRIPSEEDIRCLYCQRSRFWLGYTLTISTKGGTYLCRAISRIDRCLLPADDSGARAHPYKFASLWQER